MSEIFDRIFEVFDATFSFEIFGISFGDVCLVGLLFVCFLLIIAFPFVILSSFKSNRGDNDE